MSNLAADQLACRADQAGQYFPALDGLRGLMALGVIFAHVKLSWFPGAQIMMDIFFVISGFLITLILLRNIERTGQLQLFKFFSRRVRRLYPALMLVIVVYLIAAVFLVHDLAPVWEDAVRTLLYYSNWTKLNAHVYPTYFEHTWSLSIEEQFYLLWPALLLVVLKLRLSRVKVLLLFAGFMVVAVAWRNFLINEGVEWSRVYYGLDTRMDAFFMGGILALAWDAWGEGWHRSPVFLRLMQASALVLCALVLFCKPREIYYFVWQQSLVLLLSSATILVLIAPTKNRLKSFLSCRPIQGIGLMCYGIYLWHWPLLWLLVVKFNFSPIINLAIVMPSTLLLAYLTYRYVELPILSRRSRYF
ncbi:acyltransferase [Pseudomonas sp. CAU 1711]|uniref:acyltransferase family protein n=1 Tax=Pseudomonas sp. CAU 1711 TaxID=3140356 RepID=UPI00326023EB